MVSLKDAGGAVAGAVVPAVFHPIELIKFRWQVYDKDTSIRPQYKSYKHAITSIYKQSKLSGLYAGVAPNIIGSSLAWGSYFYLYDKFKTNSISKNSHSENSQSFLHSKLVNNSFTHGFAAGLITQSFTNPFWVVKTQCCLQYTEKPKSMFQVTSDIYKNRGVQGFYRGFVPGLANTVHGGVQMFAYETLKSVNPSKNNWFADISNGFVSKVFVTCLLYPITTVKVRLQEQHKEAKVVGGSRVVIKRIYKQWGITGFYRGLGIQLIRQPLATGLTFLIYEWWKRTFS